MRLIFQVAIFVLGIVLCLEARASGVVTSGIKTSEFIYQNPFDLASGGANLTRSTQEGVLFANPSLPAFGAGFLRWIFFRSTLHVGADSVDLLANLSQGKVALDQNLLAQALKTPLHVGLDMAGGAIFAPVGIGVFLSSRLDFEGRQFGSIGMPELRTRAMTYGGLVGSVAYEFGDVLAVGAAIRPQVNAEINKNFELTELLTTSGMDSKDLLQSLQQFVVYGYGVGLDVGVTWQYRSRFWDMRLASTIHDLGNTTFTGNLAPWKQVVHAGAGLTLHTQDSALHCAFDMHDLENAYHEHWTKRTYSGCKFLLSGRIGFGAGFYQGWPSFGVVLNAVLVRLEAGSYTRELGAQVGTRGRRVYFVALGGEIP